MQRIGSLMIIYRFRVTPVCKSHASAKINAITLNLAPPNNVGYINQHINIRCAYTLYVVYIAYIIFRRHDLAWDNE